MGARVAVAFEEREVEVVVDELVGVAEEVSDEEADRLGAGGRFGGTTVVVLVVWVTTPVKPCGICVPYEISPLGAR